MNPVAWEARCLAVSLRNIADKLESEGSEEDFEGCVLLELALKAETAATNFVGFYGEDK